MIERSARTLIAVVTLCAVIFTADTRADDVPANLPRGVEPTATIRLFKPLSDFTLYSETTFAAQTAARRYLSLWLGSYYQPLRNLKVGAFYQLQYGARHDEDWIQSGTTRKWRDTFPRGESSLVLDVSPRAELGFLPGRDWVGEFKTRYAYNFFDGEQTLRLRPGLTYFWLRDGAPFVSFFGQSELYVPLNYGRRRIYEVWYYLGALFHLHERVQLGAYGALKWQAWGSTDDFTAATGRRYTVEAPSTVLGLLAVFRL